MFIKFILILNLVQIAIIAQSGTRHFGNFEKANSFAISEFGYLYVTDLGSNSIIKIDTLGNILQTIGGFGWDQQTFDHPSDIDAAGRQVYVADKNNNRLQIFDAELNYLSGIASANDEEISFSYPTIVKVSNMGDIFLYDSEKMRILKFNPIGELLAIIGDYDAGSFCIENLKDFTITDDNKIIAINDNTLYVFDIYGNAINKLSLDFNADAINSYKNILLFSAEQGIQLGYLQEETNNLTLLNKTFEFHEFEIKDLCYMRDKIYLLTPNHIYIYNYPLK